MNPFLYLQLRRVKNGFIRSFRTPVRAFMTIFIVAYLVGCFALFFFGDVSKPARKEHIEALDPRIPLALLTLFHSAFILYAIAPPRRILVILSETDIANILPVPIDRWKVIRFFLFARAYLTFAFGTLAMSAYTLWFLRNAIPGLFPRERPAFAPAFIAAYILFSIAATAGLMFWRIVLDIRREFGRVPRRLFFWSVLATALLAVGLAVPSLGAALRAGASIPRALAEAAESLPLAILLTPLRFLASLMIGRADLAAPSTWAGALFWIAFAATGYRALRRERNDLYEYAARLADFRREWTARMRDPIRSVRKRQLKDAGAVRVPLFLSRVQPHRAGAILWRDLIIIWRSFGQVLTGLSLVLVAAVIAWWIAVWRFDAALVGDGAWGVMTVLMLLAPFPVTMVSYASMAGLHRCAETQKPLPIAASETVAMQVLAWTLMVIAMTIVPGMVGLVLIPLARVAILSVLLLGGSFMHLSLSGLYWMSLFNPDQEDPIQRVYGGIFSMLTMLVLTIPGGAVLGVSVLLHLPIALRVALVLAMNWGIARLAQWQAARKYANFVFSE